MGEDDMWMSLEESSIKKSDYFCLSSKTFLNIGV